MSTNRVCTRHHGRTKHVSSLGPRFLILSWQNKMVVVLNDVRLHTGIQIVTYITTSNEIVYFVHMGANLNQHAVHWRNAV